MTTIINPSFESLDWTDILSGPASSNQQPEGWELTWLRPTVGDIKGEQLWDSSNPDDVATGIPECVHKLAEQLPPSQQPGGSDALILDGVVVYKAFSATAKFGAQLRQVVTGLEPGSLAVVDVPVQIHRHGDEDKYAAEVGVWANGSGVWKQPPDKTWDSFTTWGTVDADGKVEILIRFKSKWALPKDFFIDDIGYSFVPASVEPEEPEEPTGRVLVGTYHIGVFSDGTSEIDYEVADNG